jgi:predicted glycoside hydrolase/deacetylase ChbG (UPF0249 family)
MTRESRYLIVNADDFGYTNGVTEGILRAWKEGIVTSTSAMINMPGAPERIARAHQAHPELLVGLHLNITEGMPVLPVEKVPSLVDDRGRFMLPLKLVERIQHVSLDELRSELHAQAELLLTTGVNFDHIDYHQAMVAMYTPFYPLVMELAEEHQIPVRNPVPISIFGHIKLEGGGGSASAMREMMKLGMRHPILAMKLMPKMSPSALKQQSQALIDKGISTTDWFVDSFYDNATVDNFISLLEQLPPGISEVMVHPAIVDDELRNIQDEYLEAREVELNVLLDPRVREALDEYQIRLIDFGELINL